MYCGKNFAILLLNNGTLIGFGENSFGQLGIGTTSSLEKPTIIPISNVKDIVCGGSH
ncbi:chromosome condensation regulator RCC1, partial [Brevibacillus sp. MCWH]|nr:chromosome condensation regulator RCC1 [Brevibacillus sp. MCWH]